MDNSQWKPPKSLEDRYEKSLWNLLNEAWGWVSLQSLTVDSLLTNLASLINHPQFAKECQKLATGMVTTSQTHLARSWREAARKGTGNGELYRYLKSGISPQMYQVMRRQIAENAMLISNTPYNIAYYVVNEIQEQYMGGNRPAGVLEMLMEQFPLASRNRVKLIARTEIGKASTTLTMAQAFDIGAEWYLWSTWKM